MIKMHESLVQDGAPELESGFLKSSELQTTIASLVIPTTCRGVFFTLCSVLRMIFWTIHELKEGRLSVIYKVPN
jgi:hypothetical protein